MERLLTVKETSKVLKVNPNYVYSLINAKILKAVLVGSLKIREKHLNEYIEGLPVYNPQEKIEKEAQ